MNFSSKQKTISSHSSLPVSNIYFIFTAIFLISSIPRVNSTIFRGKHHDANTFRPVIGILTQPSSFKDFGYPATEYSYIAASYIKYIESAGAEVVPIQWDLPFDQLDTLLGKINGVLFPGGATSLVKTNPPGPSLFLETGIHIINKAIEFNRKGNHFPIWGTCLGYELLALAISGNFSLLISVVDGNNVARPINITQEGLEGIYSSMSKELIEEVKTKNLSYYHHVKTPDPQSYSTNENLFSNFSIAGWAYDSQAGPYVANIQGKVHPFFGNQFHPEKNSFEWQDSELIPHSLQATFVQQHYAFLFVNHSMQSQNSFDSQTDFFKYSIYNYQPKHLEINPQFEQIYFFKNHKTYTSENGLIGKHSIKNEPSTPKNLKNKFMSRQDFAILKDRIVEI